MGAAQVPDSVESGIIYPGFKFDVIKIADDIYIVKDQVTQQVREVEHDPALAIEDCKRFDMFAGWEDFDNDYS